MKTADTDLSRHTTAGSFTAAGRDEPALAAARKMILTETATCILLQNGEIVHTGSGRGVKPLLAAYEQNPNLLRGAVLADKIIGKAAAMIVVLGGVRQVFALTMSTAAREYLAAHNIPSACDHEVKMIFNRTGDGLCPLEQSVLELSEPEAGYRALKETIRRLMAK
ncbi:MAG: DUF1893 domain-containing protein [Acutalibacteraceae bacterium]